MALEAAFTELLGRVLALREALVQLSVCFDDKPPKGETYPVQRFGETLVDVLGLGEELGASADEVRRAADHPADLDGARRALARCQERLQQVSARFTTELVPFERIAELQRFARRRRGEWPGWMAGLRAGIEDCQPILRAVNESLFRCWQEIAERAGATNVSVRSTNVGRLYAAPEPRIADQHA